MRWLISVLVVVAAIVATQAAASGSGGTAGAVALAATTKPGAGLSGALARRCGDRLAPVLCAVRWERHVANMWRVRAGSRRWHPLGAGVYAAHRARRLWFLARWKRRAGAARRFDAAIWVWYRTSGARCVHGREGSWTDGGLPYLGGFQYDPPTWAAAGGLRYAARPDLASPAVQVRVTRAKVRRDGWGAWPRTAAACGLL